MKRQINETGVCTLHEVAELTGCSMPSLYRAIRSDELTVICQRPTLCLVQRVIGFAKDRRIAGPWDRSAAA